jgi:Cu(I)/Ag(I) efflux system membrane fusion protein
VRLQLPNPNGLLRPGMFANVSVDVPGSSGLIVPADAVLDSGTEQVVFIADGDGHFTPRGVKVGARAGSEAQILEGVSANDRVASGATFLLDSESQLRATLPNFAAPQAAVSGTPAPTALVITLATTPDPATTGENQFEVSVKDASGAPIADADVLVQLYMPAMPTMNMPPMRNEVALSAAGAGVYRGTGQVLMAGRWDATVTVSRRGQPLGSLQRPLVAR